MNVSCYWCIFILEDNNSPTQWYLFSSVPRFNHLYSTYLYIYIYFVSSSFASTKFCSCCTLRTWNAGEAKKNPPSIGNSPLLFFWWSFPAILVKLPAIDCVSFKNLFGLGSLPPKKNKATPSPKETHDFRWMIRELYRKKNLPKKKKNPRRWRPRRIGGHPKLRSRAQGSLRSFRWFRV